MILTNVIVRRGLFHAARHPAVMRPLFAMQSTRSYIKEEKTPNPSAIKFIFPETVLPESAGTGLFFEKSKKPTARELARSPLAKKMLDCDGVDSVFLGRDFITITKNKDSRWVNVKEDVHKHFFAYELGDLKAIADQVPGEEAEKVHSDTDILETDSEVVAAIKELIETRVRPSVQEDGGDIFFVDFLPATGTVQVNSLATCIRCIYAPMCSSKFCFLIALFIYLSFFLFLSTRKHTSFFFFQFNLICLFVIML